MRPVVLLAEVALNLLLNLTSGLIGRNLALQITRWGWLLFLLHVSYVAAVTQMGRSIFTKARRRFGRHRVLSYLAVMGLSAVVGLIYWRLIDRAYLVAGIKVEESHVTSGQEEAAEKQPPHPGPGSKASDQSAKHETRPKDLKAQSSNKPDKFTLPASMKDVFLGDFGNTLRVRKDMVIKNSVDGWEATLIYQWYLDFPARSKYLGIFVPYSKQTYDLCRFVSDDYGSASKIIDPGGVAGGMAGEDSKDSSDLVFTGRIYVYYEGSLTIEQKAELIKLYRSKGLDLTLRGDEYLLMKNLWGRPAPRDVSH